MKHKRILNEQALAIKYDTLYLKAWLKGLGSVSEKKRKQLEAQREAAMLEAKNLAVPDTLNEATNSLKKATKTLLVDTGVLDQATVDEGFELSKSISEEAGKYVRHLKEVVDDKSMMEGVFDLKSALKEFTSIFKSFFGLHKKDHKHDKDAKHKANPKQSRATGSEDDVNDLHERLRYQTLHTISYKNTITAAQMKKGEEEYKKLVEKSEKERELKLAKDKIEKQKKQLEKAKRNRPKFKLALGYHGALEAKRRATAKKVNAAKKNVTRTANRVVVSASKRPLVKKMRR